jgi:UDP:flavonoid glycosyltransferase YjiC (YdhE family)
MMTVPPVRDRLHQMVPLGWALRTAGHEVRVASAPGFEAEVSRTGCIAAPAAPAGSGFAGQWKPSLVIWDEQAPAGQAVARAAGVPGVRLLGIFGPGQQPEDGHEELTLDSALPSATQRPGRLPLRYTPYAGAAVVPAWLRRKPRRLRICLSFAGTGPLPPAVLDAAGRLDAEVICPVTAERIPEGTSLPDAVRLVGEIPLSVLLPACSALVHDGTVTVAAIAAAYGLPQLALAAPPSDSLMAQAVAAGACLTAEPGSSTAGSLAASMSALLYDAAVREHASALSREMAAMPSPRDVVPELERIAAQADRSVESVLTQGS